MIFRADGKQVRSSVVDSLFVITNDPVLRQCDWTKPPKEHAKVMSLLQTSHLPG